MKTILSYSLLSIVLAIGQMSCDSDSEKAVHEAKFTMSAPDADGSITFTNTSTNAVGSVWDFGDGTDAITVTSPTHKYTLPGTKVVTLISTAKPGAIPPTSSMSTEIIFLEHTASFTAVEKDGTWTFTNTSTNAAASVWDFGDNTPTVTTTSPTHVYANPGYYSVTLTSTAKPGALPTTSTQTHEHLL